MSFTIYLVLLILFAYFKMNRRISAAGELPVSSQFSALLDQVPSSSYHRLSFQLKKWRRDRELKRENDLKEKQDRQEYRRVKYNYPRYSSN